MYYTRHTHSAPAPKLFSVDLLTLKVLIKSSKPYKYYGYKSCHHPKKLKNLHFAQKFVLSLYDFQRISGRVARRVAI